MDFNWTEGYSIKVEDRNGQITICANREGLLSLADQFVALAEGRPGDHVHYDEYNSLEEGSKELIIERIG